MFGVSLSVRARMRRTGGGSTGDIGTPTGGNGRANSGSASGPVGGSSSSKGKIGKIRKSLSRRLSLSRRNSSSSTPRERRPVAAFGFFSSKPMLLFLLVSSLSEPSTFCDR